MLPLAPRRPATIASETTGIFFMGIELFIRGYSMRQQGSLRVEFILDGELCNTTCRSYWSSMQSVGINLWWCSPPPFPPLGSLLPHSANSLLPATPPSLWLRACF